MKIAESIAEMQDLRQKLAEPVGFVPTMGYLHEGHLALIRRARAENASVVASIFVNPTQFGPAEDLASYPRDLESDLRRLEAGKTDIVFIPTAADMYPPGFDIWVEAGKIAELLEGASRPGHFRGVVTVVAKLFNITRPNRAYFGQKDAQQLIVIEKMARDLNMGLEIVNVPTVREADGLAMSSRNSYLNPDERQAATVLYKALGLARQLYQSGERDAKEIRLKMLALIQKEPLAGVDYVSIADAGTLDELDRVSPPALISMAVRIGKTRLIDNTVLD